MSGLAQPDDHMVTTVPLDCIKLVKPDDGLPSAQDFLTTTISFLFNGSRLHREPIDLNVIKGEVNRPFAVKKGFTRLLLSGILCCIFHFVFFGDLVVIEILCISDG